MNKLLNILLSFALLTVLAITMDAQTSDDVPRLRELKGKKLLEEITPLQHKNGLWGYANAEGKFTIKPVFTQACEYEGQLARVKVDDKWGTISRNGLYIVSPTYDSIAVYSSDSLAIAFWKGKAGLLDAKGKRIQKIGYASIEYAMYGYRSKIGDKFGTINNLGETILEPQFDDIVLLDKQRGLEQVCLEGKWGILKDGLELLTHGFDQRISFLQNGAAGKPDLYLARQKGKVGVVTSYGQFVVPCVYDEIVAASSGTYFITLLNGKYGAVSLKMAELFAPILESRPYIGEDVFKVHDDGRFYAANINGSVPFEDCSDLYYTFKPDEYATTTSIPAWSKTALIDENLLDRQVDMDNARLLGEIMEKYGYDPVLAQEDESRPKGYMTKIPDGIVERFGISDGGRFVHASGTVSDYESGYHNLHYKARMSSGIDICLVSVPSTGEFLITREGDQFSLKSALEKFNVKEFDGIYPKDCAMLSGDRIMVRFAFIRPASMKEYPLVENDPAYLPVPSYGVYLHNGGANPSVETHAVVVFDVDSLAAISFAQLPDSGDYTMEGSLFGGFYTHATGSVIADEKNPLVRYDRNGNKDWEFIPRNGEVFYSIEETENYIYLCGSTKNSMHYGVEVPFVVQLSKRGVREKELTKDYQNARFTGLICKDYLIYAKASFLNEKATGPDYYPHFLLEDLGDNFGVRPKCVWEEWGDGIIGGCGLVSHEGEWLNAPVLNTDQMCTAYDWEFTGFASDYLIVRHMGKYGLMDRSGEMVIEAKYDLLETLENPNFIKASNDDLFGVIDVNGNVRVPLEYDYVGRMCEDIIIVKKDGLYGCFDIQGKLVVPMEYEEIREYAGGMARVRFIGKFGFIDKNGVFVVAPFSDEVENFKEDACLVTMNNKVGLVNLKGDWIAAPMYEDGGSFSGGYAYLAQAGKYGYVDKAGEFVIPMKYSGAKDFHPVYGLASVSENGQWGVIDVRGNYVVPAQFDDVSVTADGYICAQKDGRYGVFSSSGREIYPVVCDDIDFDPSKALFRFGVVNARLNDQRIRIDQQGNAVYQYSLISDN